MSWPCLSELQPEAVCVAFAAPEKSSQETFPWGVRSELAASLLQRSLRVARIFELNQEKISDGC